MRRTLLNLSVVTQRRLAFSDVALQRTVGIADSLHNLHLVAEFCNTTLPERTLHVTVTDLAHAHADLKANVLVWLAELFYTFEVVRPECVTGDGECGEPGRVRFAFLCVLL